MELTAAYEQFLEYLKSERRYSPKTIESFTPSSSSAEKFPP